MSDRSVEREIEANERRAEDGDGSGGGNDDGSVVDALLAAGYQWAREHGCHVLELMGLPSSIRSVAERSRPFSRTLPTYPFFYKAPTRELQGALQGENAWYPSIYDGDTCLV